MTNSKAKYMMIEQSIIDKIKKNVYRPNDKIESEYELCNIYHASRITIRRALDDLCVQNILYRRQGAERLYMKMQKTLLEVAGRNRFL